MGNCLRIPIITVSSATATAATTVTPTATTSAAPSTAVPAAVPAIDTALAECLDVLALFLAAPLPAAKLVSGAIGAILGLARDVIEERRGLVVCCGSGGLGVSSGLHARCAARRGVCEGRAGDRLLHKVLLIEFGVRRGEIEIGLGHLHLGWAGTASTTSAAVAWTSTRGIHPHLVDLFGEVVHGVAAGLLASGGRVEFSHRNGHSSLGGLCCVP